MDWPVIGAVTALAIVGGAVTYEALTLLRSDMAPTKTPHVLASYGTSVERTAYDIPGFGNSASAERAPNNGASFRPQMQISEILAGTSTRPASWMAWQPLI